MVDADQLLRDGDVDGARVALVDIVRTRPGDDQARMFLFQLLAVNGEWDKALKQLNALVQVASQAQLLGVTYGQAIAAEEQRAAVFAGTAEMALLAGHGGWAEGVARAITLFARGDGPGGIRARDEAFDAAPDLAGSMDGHPFEWIADADSRFGPTMEAIVAGRYGLIPFDVVESIRSEGPRDLRDTVWYPVEIAFRSGHSGAAFLPARYPGSEASANPAHKLGRLTGWIARDWGDEGLGQRLWTLSDGSERGLLDVRDIAFL
ncbi:type VI secretion system accessory protein TagJ [Novosphingobium album (ex Liu et al. 2023)]|uniref:Type VI secretion system accessory protein TagJ n=1 Tax=Novosphingobium album (ex Liu et al. 2023) TaxID=3031130 RepID=A0ABT5WUW8_9SPHN|nr:type VI secretion system accessory protein TagJ [Novosphingobium album (ex Liu et al. 2023)]MDE8653701.1 type VI secretion system accessory protein TagJ [Novosphingobium album (ex Liu et al. 2023)]